jgi:hypothetical protein
MPLESYSDHILELTKVPKSLIVMGCGCEKTGRARLTLPRLQAGSCRWRRDLLGVGISCLAEWGMRVVLSFRRFFQTGPRASRSSSQGRVKIARASTPLAGCDEPSRCSQVPSWPAIWLLSMLEATMEIKSYQPSHSHPPPDQW